MFQWMQIRCSHVFHEVMILGGPSCVASPMTYDPYLRTLTSRQFLFEAVYHRKIDQYPQGCSGAT